MKNTVLLIKTLDKHRDICDSLESLIAQLVKSDSCRSQSIGVFAEKYNLPRDISILVVECLNNTALRKRLIGAMESYIGDAKTLLQNCLMSDDVSYCFEICILYEMLHSLKKDGTLTLERIPKDTRDIYLRTCILKSEAGLKEFNNTNLSRLDSLLDLLLKKKVWDVSGETKKIPPNLRDLAETLCELPKKDLVIELVNAYMEISKLSESRG